MFVKSLELINFRNYELQGVEFCDKTNILTGLNAQGKTNLLEAVYLCSVGRSPRTPRDKELIRWNSENAKVGLHLKKASGTHKVDIMLTRQENKRVAINSMPISKIGELMGVVNTVFFSPSELRIIKESPSERRAFMDVALCQISKTYFYLLKNYNKIISHRNKLLKSGNAVDSAIDIWDEQLAECGSKIIKTRKGFAKRIGEFFIKNHLYLTDNQESISLEYEGIGGESKEEIKAEFLKQLLSSRERDERIGYTNVGAHKDDIKIVANGVDLRAFGSQGQQRTAALSLKFAELDLYYSEFGEYPVLLLDDVLSELDLKRQEKLIKRIDDFQTIITCTHIDEIVTQNIQKYTLFEISDGKIRKEQAYERT